MFALYVLALVSAAVALVHVHRLAVRLGLPSVLTVCVSAGGLFYLSSLIPGMLSVLTAPAVAATMCGLAMITIWSGARIERSAQPGASAGADQVHVVAMLAPAAPALFYYARAYEPWSRLPQTLSWDTVSYHLPGFIEYFQDQSLYSLQGPYQTYSYGFELIGNFPAYFFQDDWGLFIAHLYAIVFWLAAIMIAGRNVWRLGGRHFSRYLLPYAITVTVLVWMFQPALFGSVGKNDVFQCACILAFVGLLLEMCWSVGGRPDGRTVLFLIVSSVALGLAVATKPTALAYVPLVPVSCGLWWWFRKELALRWNWQDYIRYLCASLAIVAGVGGFFIARNLALIGAVVAPETAQWGLSIAANLSNPALYHLRRETLLVVAAMFTPFTLLLARGDGGARHRVVQGTAILFSCAAVAAFLIAPWVVLPDPPSGVRWELRLGLPLFSMMAIVWGGMAATLIERVVEGIGSRVQPLGRLLTAVRAPFARVRVPLPRREGVDRRVVMAAIVCIVAGVAVPTFCRPVKGLPGFDRVNGLPRTTVYEWVQSRNRPTRIYAAGLRPYGLYGPQWRNGLFYDLHSSALRPQSVGQARVAAVIMQFHPELLLISIDAQDRGGAAGKPLVDWLRSQPACFETVFEDATVSGFSVKDGCDELMKAYPSPHDKIRMRG